MNTSLSKEVYEQLVNPTPTIRYYFLSNLSTKSTTKGANTDDMRDSSSLKLIPFLLIMFGISMHQTAIYTLSRV